ncbi:MAG: nucleotidyltransferase family protein [Patescibacteria group bacterium]
MTEIQVLKKQFNPILRKYQVRHAELFGSFARGDYKKSSDIDLIVQLGAQRGLFTLVRLKRELKKVSGRRIDLLTPRSIHPLIKKNIKREKIKIYG